MKRQLLVILGLLCCVAGSGSATPAPAQPAKATGDYVEVRTASVFAGPCHYSGEYVTVGREAIMAWSFTGGSYNGVDLAGVKVMAAVASDENLLDGHAAHRSELVFDPSTTDRQVGAVKALLHERSGTQLGTIVAVRQAPISFTHHSDGYEVAATGFASMSVQYMPDDSCCTQPGLVWYEPLTPLQGRKVGFTEAASFTGSVCDRWERSGENSAFYGAFAF